MGVHTCVFGEVVRAWKRGVEMCKYVCTCTSSCLGVHEGSAAHSSPGGAAAVVVRGKGWREFAGPAGGSRCGATELTGPGPSGRMNANPNLC